ncbi:hypothetical protein LOZ80_25840 [Paenibacillus sp. HWE-109]|uniref:hypothetical protein n=1 Tax=Paenibacillus sp. HWE-109 TaxID=1306526 RepID=UPI001EE0CC56|nr:hypothetical protein [Paenibacillus sp. HWE-109]UKS25003.1 hypothetical protein LOZ80_25840 [Paenibacillus sp. HWE-109]
MARRKIEGVCHICGRYGALTFEHIPPEAAFNNHQVRNPKFADYMDKGPDYFPTHAPIQQRGAGNYTLCARCNNSTGAWYVPAYVDLAYQSGHLLARSEGESSLQFPFRLYPLRVIKQVIAMFCSVNNSDFIKKYPDLLKFLLNKETKYIDPRINIYAYLTASHFSRQSGVTAALSGTNLNLYSEIGFAPIGFIMTLESFPPDSRLLDVSYFATYDYDHFDTFTLTLPVLPISYYMPGDFRTKDEIMKAYEENINS